MDFKKDFSVEKVEGSQVKITGEIPYEEVVKHRAKTLKTLGMKMKVDGFREGHVPEAIVVQKIGEMALLTEMAESALAVTYPEILKAHNIDAIGHPKIEITKIALENPLGFTATVAVLPEIKLGDYKKIAKNLNKEKEDVLVTDEDVEKQVKDILRQKAAYERLQAKAAKGGEGAEVKETHTHDDGTVHEGPAHDHEGKSPHPSANGQEHAEHNPQMGVGDKPLEDINDLEIPELTDETVRTLGAPGQFETVDDFKSKLREHLEIEKKREAEAKHRASVTDKIIEESQFELPQVLVDSEIGQMFSQMEEDIKRAGLSVDDYLSHMKKTREDLKVEWTPTAEKRARLQLVLNEIAKSEEILPEPAKVEEEAKHLLEHYKNADVTRVKIYVASVMQNDAVMKFLESQ